MMKYHEPALLLKTIEGLQIKPDGIYIDATFGGGGHSKEILKRLKKGRLIAFDQDEDVKANSINDNRFKLVHGNFKFLSNYLKYFEIQKVDGLLADLGVSFHHFDNADRGFSYRFEGALDMRMNKHSKLTAGHIINNYNKDRMLDIFTKYGELNNAKTLVNLILSNRDKKEILTINQFLNAISSFIPRKNENQILSKIFQALRIEVNNELENLKEMLLQLPNILNNGGRAAIISYHSLEDRLVKNFFRWGNFYKENQKDIFGNSNTPFKAITKKPIVPDENEIEQNSRARSAKLRITEKI